MSGRPNLAAMRAKLAETAEQQGSQLDKAIASQPDKSPGFRTERDWQAKAEQTAVPAAELIAAQARANPAPKVEKRSTSLYLSGAASRAIKTLAASRGVRPHRVIDDALAEYLAKPENGGHDFEALNTKD